MSSIGGVLREGFHCIPIHSFIDDLSLLARALSGSPDPEPTNKPLSRAQKKNERKKQKKKEKKANEVAFEIEEVTTGVEEVTLGEKSSKSNGEPETKRKEERVSSKILYQGGKLQ